MRSLVPHLRRLYEAADEYVPVPPPVVLELQRLGYEIEVHPHFGARLLGAPDRLMADDLLARIKTRVIGRRILVFEETASTNDVVARLAPTERDEGLVVFAESQTAGRGRQGRPWVSPARRGLWFSVLLRPRLPPAAFPRLTVAASVAITRVLRAASFDARIKWPNDVTIHGRKVAGVLTETPSAVCLGIGLNVNCQPADFPPEIAAQATSLAIEAGQPQNRLALAAQLLMELDALYQQVHHDFAAVVAAWAQWSTTLGRQLVVQTGTERLEGHAQALDDDGALLLRLDNGRVQRLVAAEVLEQR